MIGSQIISGPIGYPNEPDREILVNCEILGIKLVLKKFLKKIVYHAHPEE